MAETLPVIDLSAMIAGEPGAVVATAAALGRAARDIGFFYVTGHGVAPAFIDRIFAESQRFFDQPASRKNDLAISKSKHNRGYIGMKGETLDTTKPADLKEAFNIGLDLAADDPRVIAGDRFRGVNVWPALPGWREAMLGYYDAVWRVGRLLHRTIAVDLGMPADYFEDKLDQPMAILRLLHYPPHPADAEAGQIGAGEHTDYGTITLLMTDEVAGLEVRRRDGVWLAAPKIPGAFVCNIGDCMMRWTNDIYVSTPHRVVNRGGRERYSIAFFLDPNPDAVVACLPTCATAARPARYPPVSGADYLMERLTATYDFLQKKAM